MKILIQNLHPIFVPKRAVRIGATGAKQLNSAQHQTSQLQTVVYLS